MIPCTRAIHSWTAALFLSTIAISAVASAAETTAEEFSVELRTDREQIAVADPVGVTVSATAPPGWKILFPETPVDSEHLRVIEASDHLQENDDGTRTAWRHLKLESLLPGRYPIGPLNVRFTPEDGADDSAASSESTASSEVIQRSTGSITIRVRSAIGFFGSRELREIDGTVWIPWTWRQWAIAAAAIFAASVLGWASYRRVERWLGSQRVSQRSLLHELDRLDEARLHRSVPNDQLIISVADVVRQSLRLADGPHSVYRTTEEWIEYLQRSPLIPAGASGGNRRLPRDAVELVLREADAIKFAGRPATYDQSRRCLGAARRTVQSLLGERASSEIRELGA